MNLQIQSRFKALKLKLCIYVKHETIAVTRQKKCKKYWALNDYLRISTMSHLHNYVTYYHGITITNLLDLLVTVV